MPESNKDKAVAKKSSFATDFELNGASIENARRKSLESTIGDWFKMEDASVIKKGDEIKTVYSVRTLNSQSLPVGSLINISVKNSQNIFDKQKALDTLTGTKSYVVRFDKISHWIFGTQNGLREGLTAENVEFVNVPVTLIMHSKSDDNE